MNILLLGHFSPKITDSKRVSGELAVKLARQGHGIITSSHQQGKIGFLLDLLITIISYRSRYDLACLEVYSGPAFTWAQLSGVAIRLIKKPLVLVLHGGNLPTFAKQFPARVEKLLNSANAVVAPSHYLRLTMKDIRDDIQVIPNPLNMSLYHFKERKKLQPALIWLRAFHEIYNPSLVPKVMAILTPTLPDIHITMIGPDEGDGSFQKTRQLAEALGVSDSIEFAGEIPRAHVPAWLLKGDIFINTTNVDNTPVSVLEAMACGLCVVSTNVGGIPYLLEDGKDALLVPPNDPEAIASAICRILTEPGLAENLSTYARKKAELFDWSVIIPQWETLFSEVTIKV